MIDRPQTSMNSENRIIETNTLPHFILCQDCGKIFRLEKSLMNHMKVTHGHVKDFQDELSYFEVF